ncbi:MAG: transporter substrate-binding domain-containing protein [Bacteroidales bacterium]
MKKVLLLFFALLVAVAFVSSQNQTEEQISDTLIIGVKPAPPFIMKEGQQWKGASVDLWEKISEDLQVNYKYKEYNLSELISAIARSEIDLSINPLTVTSDRIEQFNFTQPFYISSLTVATQKKSKNFIPAFLKNFFSPDFFKALLGLLFLIFIFGMIIWLAEKKKNPNMFAKGWKGVGDGFWWSAVTMTTVGYGDKAPVTKLGRIFGFIWMFTAIIVISGFTASIASSLTVSQINTSIKKVNDLRNVSVATVKGSSSEKYLNEKSILYQSYPELDAAIQALHKDKVTALVYDDAILNYSIAKQNLQNDIEVLPLKFNKQYYSFALPYNMNLQYEINSNLMEIIESPYWQNILSRYQMEAD